MRLVDVDEVLRGGELGLNQSLLRRVIGSLRDEHVQERIDARLVPRLGQEVGVGSRGLLALAAQRSRRSSFRGEQARRTTSRNAVWIVLLVGGDGRIALRFGQPNVGMSGAGLEDRVGRVGAGAPAEGAAGEELEKRRARETEQTGQRDAWEQARRARRRCCALAARS